MTRTNNPVPLSFDAFEYQRPDLSAVSTAFEEGLSAFQKAISADTQQHNLQRGRPCPRQRLR